jgi:hypothetical protein
VTRGVSETLPTQLPAHFRVGFAWRLDRRCKAVREIAADLLELWTDLGGVESLSTQERILCERVVYIRRRILEHETAVMNSAAPAMTPGEHANATNTLVGLLKALGLERRARDVHDLRSYLAERSGGTGQSE